MDPSKYPGLDLLYEVIKAKYSSQMERVDSIDKKAGILLGFTSAILSIFLGSNLVNPSIFQTIWQKALFYSALFFIFSSSGLSVWAYRVYTYHSAPNPRKAYENKDKSEKYLMFFITTALVRAYEDNETKIQSKKSWLTLAVASLLLSLVLVGVAFGYYLYIGGW